MTLLEVAFCICGLFYEKREEKDGEPLKRWASLRERFDGKHWEACLSYCGTNPLYDTRLVTWFFLSFIASTRPIGSLPLSDSQYLICCIIAMAPAQKKSKKSIERYYLCEALSKMNIPDECKFQHQLSLGSGDEKRQVHPWVQVYLEDPPTGKEQAHYRCRKLPSFEEERA